MRDCARGGKDESIHHLAADRGWLADNVSVEEWPISFLGLPILKPVRRKAVRSYIDRGSLSPLSYPS